MSKQPEKVIENQILDYLKIKKIFAFKVNKTGIYDPKKKTFRLNRGRHNMNGISDIIAVVEGRFVAIEVKTKTGRVSEHQKTFLANVREKGGVGIIARSVGDVHAMLEQIDLGVI